MILFSSTHGIDLMVLCVVIIYLLVCCAAFVFRTEQNAHVLSLPVSRSTFTQTVFPYSPFFKDCFVFLNSYENNVIAKTFPDDLFASLFFL